VKWCNLLVNRYFKDFFLLLKVKILSLFIMKGNKPHITPWSEKTKKENPIAKMIRDKKRIQEAIANGIPVSSLKDIKFVHPI